MADVEMKSGEFQGRGDGGGTDLAAQANNLYGDDGGSAGHSGHPAPDNTSLDATLLHNKDGGALAPMAVEDDTLASHLQVPGDAHGPPAGSSLLGAAFHIFKGNVGVGIFLLPSVYNYGGYILSPILGFGVGFMVVDAMMMLLNAKRTINRADTQTYPEVVNYVFGSLFKLLVDVAVVVCQIAFCLMYVQVAANVFSDLIYKDGYKLFVLANTLFVTPFAFLSNNLRLLSISSGIATVLVFVAAVISFIVCGQEIGKRGGPDSSVTPFGEPAKWILFVASSLTVLEGICIVLPVETSVKEESKRNVPKMIAGTMLSILVVYFLFGETGHLAYGSGVENSIVTALPLDILGDSARIALAFNLLLTHPLQFVPAIEIIDKALGVTKDRVRKSKKAFAMRIGININIMMVAMLLGADAITVVLALIGAMPAVFLAVILPPMLALHVKYACEHPEQSRTGKEYFTAMLPKKGTLTFFRFRCYAYVVLGVIIFFAGTATTLIDAAGFRTARAKRGGHGHPPVGPTPPAGQNCTCPPPIYIPITPTPSPP